MEILSAFFNSIITLWNQIIYAISNIGFFDIVDILIVAYAIYRAIGFFRETRAGQLVKGISFLLFFYILAKWCELEVVSWLLSMIFNSLILFIAIIFQPELRRVLEKVGQGALKGNTLFSEEKAEAAKCIDYAAKAAAAMQVSKTGALIVFERQTQLGEIINTGTVIDAKASALLIENVFYPKSPLHDGALIIREGKLYAAGCILPLTQNTEVPLDLGTRHRAAIGMTENSDAVVLVVSEETGIISIVKDGQIQRGFNYATTYEELKNLLIDPNTTDSDNTVISKIKHLKPIEKLRKNRKKEGSANEKVFSDKR